MFVRKSGWLFLVGILAALPAVASQTAPTNPPTNTPTDQPEGPAAQPSEGVSEKPIVMWYGRDYPPTFIDTGEMKGQGYGDKILRDLFRHTPAYRHQRVSSTFNRGLAAMRDRNNACIFGALKTPERETYIHYSTQLTATLPNRVIVRRDRADIMQPFLNEAGEVMLQPLMASPDLMVGLITGRFYSKQINAALAEHKARMSYVEMPEARYGTLLSRGRIDYSFGYPYEAAYMFRVLGDPDGFASFPVAGEQGLMAAHIGCADTPFGRQVIKDINRAVVEAGGQDVFNSYFEQWLDDAAKADFRKALQQEKASTP